MKAKYIKPECTVYVINMQSCILETSAHAEGDVDSRYNGYASDFDGIDDAD